MPIINSPSGQLSQAQVVNEFYTLIGKSMRKGLIMHTTSDEFVLRDARKQVVTRCATLAVLREAIVAYRKPRSIKS